MYIRKKQKNPKFIHFKKRWYSLYKSRIYAIHIHKFSWTKRKCKIHFMSFFIFLKHTKKNVKRLKSTNNENILRIFKKKLKNFKNVIAMKRRKFLWRKKSKIISFFIFNLAVLWFYFLFLVFSYSFLNGREWPVRISWEICIYSIWIYYFRVLW